MENLLFSDLGHHQMWFIPSGITKCMTVLRSAYQNKKAAEKQRLLFVWKRSGERRQIHTRKASKACWFLYHALTRHNRCFNSLKAVSRTPVQVENNEYPKLKKTKSRLEHSCWHRGCHLHLFLFHFHPLKPTSDVSTFSVADFSEKKRSCKLILNTNQVISQYFQITPLLL